MVAIITGRVCRYPHNLHRARTAATAPSQCVGPCPLPLQVPLPLLIQTPGRGLGQSSRKRVN